MAGFLTNLGLAAGRDLMYGQDYEEKQADIAYKKQQLAMGQIALQNAQRQQQTAQTVGAFLASETAKDQANVTDPTKAAKLYERGASMFMQNGDLAGAEEMSKLAQGKVQEAKEQLVVQAEQKHAKDEAFANAADDYAANPTADGYKAMAKAALDSGRDPTKIPMPGTPQMAAYLNNAATAGMDSKSKAEFAQKAKEQDANRAQRWQEHLDHEADTHARLAQIALTREAMKQAHADKAPEHLEINGGIYERDPTGQIKGPRDVGDPALVRIGSARQGVTAGAADKAIVASSREALRGLKIVGAMSSDQTGGPFFGMGTGNYLDRLASVASTAMTPEMAQDYDTATAGIGLEVSRALTLGAGKGPNQSTIDEMQHIVKSPPGTPIPVAVFKYANAIDIIRNRLESAGTLADPQQDALRVQALKEMEKVPDPVDVLKATRDPKLRQQMLRQSSSMSDTAARMQEEIQRNNPGGGAVGLSGTPDTGAGSTAAPIPSGWSVKEH